MSEYDFEPIRGLPEVPPEGENILWQGAPNAWTLACQAFHVRAAAAYFAVMLGWRVASGLSAGEAPVKALVAAASVAPLALLALALLIFLGWLNSRSTVYTITSRRVVLRFGAAFTKAINIPFPIIESAALKVYGQGAGDLALTLKAPNKIAFLQLWPHVRPWKVAAPQPTLRGLSDARAVADILATAMKTEVGIELVHAEPAGRGQTAGGLGPTPQAA